MLTDSGASNPGTRDKDERERFGREAGAAGRETRTRQTGTDCVHLILSSSLLLLDVYCSDAALG